MMTVLDSFVVKGRGTAFTMRADGASVAVGSKLRASGGALVEIAGVERFVGFLNRPISAGEPLGLLLARGASLAIGDDVELVE